MGGAPQLSVAEALLLPLADQLPAAADPAAPADIDCAAVIRPRDPLQADALAATHALAEAYAANAGIDARERFFDRVKRLSSADPVAADLLLADAALAGTQMPVDPADAEARLLRHADCSADAAYALGDLYRNGLLDDPEYDAAARWYERAGELGLAKSWYALTRQYLYAPALNPDWQRANRYADQARSAGYAAVDALLDAAPAGLRTPAGEASR